MGAISATESPASSGTAFRFNWIVSPSVTGHPDDATKAGLWAAWARSDGCATHPSDRRLLPPSTFGGRPGPVPRSGVAGEFKLRFEGGPLLPTPPLAVRGGVAQDFAGSTRRQFAGVNEAPPPETSGGGGDSARHQAQRRGSEDEGTSPPQASLRRSGPAGAETPAAAPTTTGAATGAK
jgi:hypothetical protein